MPHRAAAHVPAVDSGSYPVREGCAVHPLIDGEPAFERICTAVENAQASVRVTIAFLERDFQMPGGRGSLFDVLDRAAARGVDVRVIFWRSPELEKHFPDTHFHGTGEQRARLRGHPARFAARWDALPADGCHHQKSWLIDAGTTGEVAFVGGINLDCPSLAPPGHPPQPHGSTHDVYLELRGPAASDVHHNFSQRWNEASERDQHDGRWPDDGDPGPLSFPTHLSPPAGDARVQITRTVQPGRYRDATPAVDAAAFAVHAGEASVYDQYIRAIDAARRSIYVEDQAIGSPKVVGHLKAALERGVHVVFTVPGECHPAYWRARKVPATKPFFDLVASLDTHPHFTLAALASNIAPGAYQEVYVHSKLMIVDDAWTTIGSTNTADQSFKLDTEMNASVWHGGFARALRQALFREHLGEAAGSADELAAYAAFHELARANAWRRLGGEALPSLAYTLDAALYGLGAPKEGA